MFSRGIQKLNVKGKHMEKKKALTAAQKKTAALDKWKKEVLPGIELKVMEFPARIKVHAMLSQGFDSVTICGQAACQGLTGKFIEALDEEDMPIFRKYSNAQIVEIGGRVIDVSGNPGSD